LAGSKFPNAHGSYTVDISDGTLCRAATPKPGPVGGVSATRRRTFRVLGFDGAKVWNSLFHVALAETQWQDLTENPRSAVDSPVPNDRAAQRADLLYDLYLDACSKGPKAAHSFLERQRALQKQFLLKSEAILESLRKEFAGDQVLLARLAFTAQFVKSLATVTIAIAGLLLAGPEIAAGAGIALGYDVALEIIKRVGSSGESHADAVVVGFRQTAYNDVAGLAGSLRQERVDTTKEVLKKTLRHPNKSSTYRSAVAAGARLDALLKTLGIISAGVTLYTESKEVVEAYEQMQRTTRPH